jgi:hypothetical protein
MPIGAILTAIASFFVTAGSQFIGALETIIQYVWSFIKTFIEIAPKPLKVFLFLFMLLIVGNLFSRVFLGSMYACTSAGNLYQSENIFDGIANNVRLNFFGWTIIEKDSFIANNYDYVSTQNSMTNIQCRDDVPSLYFYTVDVLSYNLWILVFILLYGTPLVIKYYRSMGVLH